MPTVKSHHVGDMVFATQVGNHQMFNDVPPTPDWGGKDRHPTPPDYLVASLSSCIAAFVLQYCNRIGIDSTDMSVELTYEKETQPAHYKNLIVNIYLPNAKLTERTEAIKRVAHHCTVHETIARMEKEITVNIFDQAN